MKWREFSEAVGRIVKGVNTTPDVGPAEIKKQAAKFGNTVDKDGRPPTLGKKTKGSKTNVLFNLGLTESTHYADIAEALGEIASATEIYVDMDGVLADFFGEWAKLMNVKDFREIPKQHDISDALQKIRDTENFWLNLPLTDNAKNLLNLVRQVKGSYKILSSPLADDPRSEPHKREWIENNLGFFPPEDVIISHNKPKYATQSDGTPNILIDDYGKNIAAWEAAGGIGFKHKDHKFERTAKNIKQHMQEPVEESVDGACPRTKASQCQCESVNKITETDETLTAVCVLEQSDTVKGTILFKQQPGSPTLIVGKMTGLEPGKHGFHIHEFGDLSQGCESAGGHYDPDGVDHGDLDQGHVGDLGNITADRSGTAYIKIVAERVDLAGDRSIVGRSIVVHADEDDLGQGGGDESLKTGNAGDRLACGVITLKETIEENFAESKVNYTMPNFDFEWEEANRYEQYRKIGKEEWIKLAKTGKVVDVDNRMANDIENTEAGEEYRDDHWDGLVKAKRDRFAKALSSGQIELPIIARYSDGQLELISGNTRLTGMMRELGKAKAWIYDVPDEIADLEENFADGKVKGKSRPGRVKRAGASCNGSVTDLRKRAKNASGEKAKMYHWCANMKSGRKKGK